MSDPSSAIWRNAYICALFEIDPVQLPLRIADANAAIKERLNTPIEISRHEHWAIEGAQQRLATMEGRQVDSVFLTRRIVVE
jgi:hypothetical protein